MKITFTGKQDTLTAPQERKLATRFAKLSKMLERRGEKEASVVLTAERHLHRAEVRVNYYDQALITSGAATDQFTAISDAVEKLEQQVVKLRSKWRDTKRSEPSVRVRPTAEVPVAAPKAAAKAAGKPSKAIAAKNGKTQRPAAKPNGKPMSAEEAMLSMEEDQDYMVFQDLDRKKPSVLVRRRDGGIDLVEP